MSRLFSIILIGALIFLLLGVAFLYYESYSDRAELAYTSEMLRYEKKAVENQLLRSISLDNQPVDMVERIFSLSDTLNLEDFINRKTLVYKFSNRDCKTCTQKQLDLLNTFVKNNPGLPVLILYESNSILDYKNVLKENRTQLQIWSIRKISISDQAYFILDEKGDTQSFYIPDLENEKLGTNYLKVVKMKLK